MTKKIICATEGAAHSTGAIELAAQLAKALGVPLAVCTVNIAQGGARGPVIYSLEDAEVKAILDKAGAIAKQAGAPEVHEIALKARDPAAAVVQYAEEHGFDHIVTGTGDKHGVSRLVLGSVAANIASRAHCTVTIAR